MDFAMLNSYFCFVVFCMFLMHTISALNITINGPRSLTDKIAIVGAGPAGVHMALLLKNRGFKNVEILEKTDRVGGKSWSIEYRGAIQEMGTCYLSPDYETNIIPLVKKYISEDNFFALPSASVWSDNQSTPLTFRAYTIRFAMVTLGTTNATEAGARVVAAINTYIRLHHSLFGDYEGEIMPEPTQEVWEKINGTFLYFLKRNNLEVLQPLFYASHTMQGYGRIDEVACLYGLMWNTPAMMRGLMARILGTDTIAGFLMLKSGFQKLWENIVEKENLTVKYNVHIKSMFRSKLSGYKDVWIEYSENKGFSNIHHYDFVIWSPDMSTSMIYWNNNEILHEALYFGKLVPTYYTTAIINSANVRRGDTSIDYFFDNANKKRDGSIWVQRDSFGTTNGYSGVNYTQNRLSNGDDNLRFKTSITYQMSDQQPNDADLKTILNTTLFGMGATEIEVLYFRSWRYFPRYLPSDIVNGYIWRIIEMQGKYGMWYIGSSVCYESVKSVVEYNKMLVGNMKMPIANETNTENESGSGDAKVLINSKIINLVCFLFCILKYLS